MSDAGGQSPAPLNAPPGGPVGIGVQAGFTAADIVRLLLIAATLGGGLFVYSGAPGSGDLVAWLVAPGTTEDPFGNPVEAIFGIQDPSSGAQLILTFGNPFGAYAIFSTGRPGVGFYGQIYSDVANEGLPDEVQGFIISGPVLVSPHNDQVYILLQSAAGNGSGGAGGNFVWVDTSGTAHIVGQWGSAGFTDGAFVIPVLQMPSGSSPGTPSGGPVLWAVADGPKFNDTDDNTYDIGRSTQTNTAASTIPATGSNIAASWTNLPKGTYLIEGHVVIQNITTTDPIGFSFNCAGTIVNPDRIDFTVNQFNSTNTNAGSTRANTAFQPTLAAGANYTIFFRGFVTFSSSTGNTLELEIFTVTGVTATLEDSYEVSISRSLGT